MDEMVVLFAMMTVYPAARLAGLWPVFSAVERRRAWRLGFVVVAATTAWTAILTGANTGVEAEVARGSSDADVYALIAVVAAILTLMLTGMVAWARLVSMGPAALLKGKVPSAAERVPTAWSRARGGARWVLENSLGGGMALQAAWILRGEALLPVVAMAMVGFLAILGGLGGVAYHLSDRLRRGGRRLMANAATAFAFALLALLFLGVAYVTPS